MHFSLFIVSFFFVIGYDFQKDFFILIFFATYILPVRIRINFHSIQKLKTHSKFVLGDVYEIDALYAILRCDLDAFNEANTITLSFYENCG